MGLCLGAVTDLFTANTGSTASISPDGSEISFFDNVDKTTSGLYIARLDDGSNRRLVALIRMDVYTEQQMGVDTPVWSPDGKWLAVSIFGVNPNRPTAALVNPQTCQIVPLQLLGQLVSGCVESNKTAESRMALRCLSSFIFLDYNSAALLEIRSFARATNSANAILFC